MSEIMDNIEGATSPVDDIKLTNNDNQKNNDEPAAQSNNETGSQNGENGTLNDITSRPILQDASPCSSETADAEPSNQDESYDDEPDETMLERLWGLTEMFPEPVRDYASKITDITKQCASQLYSFSCSAAWIVVSSSVVLFAPAIFENERAQARELQMSQNKQMLLGPSTVMGLSAAKAKNN